MRTEPRVRSAGRDNPAFPAPQRQHLAADLPERFAVTYTGPATFTQVTREDFAGLCLAEVNARGQRS